MKEQRTWRIPTAAAAVLIVLLPLFAMFLKDREALRFEEAVIGQLAKDSPEITDTVLNVLFRPEVTEENIARGEEMMLRFGYTDQAVPILSQRIFSLRTALWLLIAGVLLAGGVLLLIYAVRRSSRDEVLQLRQENLELRKDLQEMENLRMQNRRMHEFTENIAHQIKTPVSRAVTSLELLEEEAEEGSASEADSMLLPRIRECLGHLESIRVLISRLLDIGRLEAGEVLFHSESVDLKEMLGEILEEAEASKLILLPADESFVWEGNADWTKEAFRNLVVNAEEHSRTRNGFDEVKEASGTFSGPEITAEELPDEYRITIRDHGPGFSEDELPFIFDRFFRPKEMKKGHVGLGMNFSKLVIEGQKGRISAGNHEEGGAVVTVLLPRQRLMK